MCESNGKECKVALNPRWIKLDLPNRRVDWSNQFSLTAALSPRGGRQSGLQRAINHGTFPGSQPSTAASHTGEKKGRKCDWLAGPEREQEGEMGVCECVWLNDSVFFFLFFAGLQYVVISSNRRHRMRCLLSITDRNISFFQLSD